MTPIAPAQRVWEIDQIRRQIMSELPFYGGLFKILLLDKSSFRSAVEILYKDMGFYKLDHIHDDSRLDLYRWAVKEFERPKECSATSMSTFHYESFFGSIPNLLRIKALRSRDSYTVDIEVPERVARVKYGDHMCAVAKHDLSFITKSLPRFLHNTSQPWTIILPLPGCTEHLDLTNPSSDMYGMINGRPSGEILHVDLEKLSIESFPTRTPDESPSALPCKYVAIDLPKQGGIEKFESFFKLFSTPYPSLRLEGRYLDRHDVALGPGLEWITTPELVGIYSHSKYVTVNLKSLETLGSSLHEAWSWKGLSEWSMPTSPRTIKEFNLRFTCQGLGGEYKANTAIAKMMLSIGGPDCAYWVMCIGNCYGNGDYSTPESMAVMRDILQAIEDLKRQHRPASLPTAATAEEGQGWRQMDRGREGFLGTE